MKHNLLAGLSIGGVIMICVAGIAQATTITETWYGNVLSSAIPDLVSGQSVNWTITYDDQSTSMHQMLDGPDKISRTQDDTIFLTYTLIPGHPAIFYSDMIINFNGVLGEIISSYEQQPYDIISQTINCTYIDGYGRPNNYSKSDRMHYYGDGLWFYAESFGSGYLTLGSTDGYNEPHVRFTVRKYPFAVPNINSASVPEPATMLLFGTGIAGLAVRKFRRKK